MHFWVVRSYLRNVCREFHYVWHKYPPQLKEELMEANNHKVVIVVPL